MIDITNLSKYEENNRIEAKGLKADFQIAFGSPILLLPIPMAE